MSRRYAETTTVPVAKSRSEIDGLLRGWGARQVMWADDYEGGRVLLRFLWHHESVDYIARFTLQLPTDDELKEQARYGGQRHGRIVEGKLERLRQSRGKPEHRQLLLWLKACFNAVEAGIVTAETLFLPFLEGATGETIAEVFLPRLPKMLETGGAANLLPERVQ